MRCQVESLREVLPTLDRDGDGQVTLVELGDARDEVLTYVGDHYRLRTATDRHSEGGTALSWTGLSVRATPDRDRPFGPLEWGEYGDWVDVALSYQAGREIRDLTVEIDLFFDTSPAHYDVTVIVWDAGRSSTLVLDQESPRRRSDPTVGGTLREFCQLGFEHILSGHDHLAFVLCLVLASRHWRRLIGVVTAFTVAHSATLGLTATGVVVLSGHGRLVEAAIALSIAYVATDQLVFPKLSRSRWIEAFVFGLVHGLGFAGFLEDSLVNAERKLTALFGFNVGVELGQLLVVTGCAAVLAVLPRRETANEEPHLAPRWLRIAGNSLVALLGFTWFFERIL